MKLTNNLACYFLFNSSKNVKLYIQTTSLVVLSFQFGDAKVDKDSYSATLFKIFFSKIFNHHVVRDKIAF